MLPSFRRCIKVARTALIFECFLFLVIGFCGYLVLGKFTPDLLMVRAPYKGKNEISELILKILITFYFLLNSLGLAMFNPGIREEIGKIIDLTKRVNYIICSLVPFMLICILACLWPNVQNCLNFFGYTVYNFNGFILPFLMIIVVMRR